jgi:hypothetical protein
MQPSEDQSWLEQWWLWATVPAIVIAVLGWMVFHSEPALETPPTSTISEFDQRPPTDTDAALDKYVLWIKQNTPVVSHILRADLATGEQFDVPSVDMRHNYVGGEATDLMSLSMAVPDETSRRPEPGPQEWQLKTVVAPKSKAAYMEIDLMNAAGGRLPQAAENMRGWDLAKLCPPLASVPVEEWTDDEMQYVHYLTMRTMGFDDTEVGFAALWAAYASNYALWHGDNRSVPGAAYYALAAAHFDRHLTKDGPATRRAKAVTFMVDAEMHRLLGRLWASFKCLEAAEDLKAELQEPERKALEFMQGLVAKGDKTLQRLPETGIPEPPIGWYIDHLFESINGDLDIERAKWTDLRDVDGVCAEINRVIAEKYAAAASQTEPPQTAFEQGRETPPVEAPPTSAAPPTPPAGH